MTDEATMRTLMQVILEAASGVGPEADYLYTSDRQLAFIRDIACLALNGELPYTCDSPQHRAYTRAVGHPPIEQLGWDDATDTPIMGADIMDFSWNRDYPHIACLSDECYQCLPLSRRTEVRP